MTRDHRPKPSGPVYAPLLGRMVECASLHVARFRGRKLKLVRDEGGRVIELRVTATLDDLKQRIATPGRYRVSARDPTSGNLLAHSDYEVGPVTGASAPPPDAPVSDRASVPVEVPPETPARPEPAAVVQPREGVPVPRTERHADPPVAVKSSPAPRQPRPSGDWPPSVHERADPPEPWLRSRAHAPALARYEVSSAPEAAIDIMLRETRHLRDQLRQCRMQADEELREARERSEAVIAAERERSEAALRASEGAREAWRARACEAEVRLAGASAWLEEREARIAALERQVAELKDEAASARMLAARTKQTAAEAAFSPLDALSQMDQAIELIGKTAERFGQRT